MLRTFLNRLKPQAEEIIKDSIQVSEQEGAQLSRYTSKIFTMSSPCLHHVFTMSSPCLHHVFTMSSPRLHHVFTMSSPRLHHVFIMSSPCLHHVFEDFKKALDTVWHAALWAAAWLYHINGNLIRAIECLYNKTTCAVYHDNNIGEYSKNVCSPHSLQHLLREDNG